MPLGDGAVGVAKQLQQRRQRSSCRELGEPPEALRILALDADEHDQLCLGIAFVALDVSNPASSP